MWLINIQTLKLELFTPLSVSQHAILSHTHLHGDCVASDKATGTLLKLAAVSTGDFGPQNMALIEFKIQIMK
jgi:hypothetical protein